MQTLLTCVLLLGLPVAAGMAVGEALRYAHGRRFQSPFAAGLALVLPLLVALLLYPLKPLIGFWDVVTVGVLAGLGTLFASHRWFARWREVALTCASVVASV